MPRQGELASWPLLYLYYRAASTGQSGRLSLALSDRTLTIDFHRGAPDAVASDHPQDALDVYLVRSGAVSEQALAQLRADPAFAGQELTNALIAARLLDPQTLWTQLVQRAQTLMLAGVIAHGGSFHFDPDAPRVPQAFPMGERWGLLTALVRMIPNVGLRKRLEPVWNRPVMKSGGSVDVVELKLTPQETRALSRFDGVSSLAQLTAAHPTEAESLMRLAYLLRHLEAISFLAPGPQTAAAPPPPVNPSAAAPGAVTGPSAHGGGDSAALGEPPAGSTTGTQRPGSSVGVAASAGTRPTGIPAPGPGPSGAPPSGARPAGTPRSGTAGTARPGPGAHPSGGAGGVRSPAAVTTPGRPAVKRPVTNPPGPSSMPSESVASLQALCANLKSQNHFERLGIKQDAPESAAKIAYFKLARQYHPDTVPPDAPEGFAKLKADIFAYIGEAYRTLSDPALRQAYLEELASGGEVDVRAILQAEELFGRATLLVKRRKFAEALPFLDEAIALNPDEGEFYAWRGWVRFCLQDERRSVGPEARGDLDRATRLNPNCAAIHHFEGSIARVRGQDEEARRHLERCLQLHPDHVEAARELRFLSTKR